MPTLQIFSLDFDGCIFHSDLTRPAGRNKSFTQKELITRNTRLWTDITTKAAEAHEVVLMVGSNRQSYSIDDLNARAIDNSFGSRKTGSCFVALNQIVTHLRTELGGRVRIDKFLLADLYANLRAGTSYDAAVSAWKNNSHLASEHAHFLMEDSKEILMLAQLHHIAALYPGHTITFNFYDDRNYDILPTLRARFSSTPELIPDNITLKLNFYNGSSLKEKANIRGTGAINYKYRQGILDIAKDCVASFRKNPTAYHRQGQSYNNPGIKWEQSDSFLVDEDLSAWSEAFIAMSQASTPADLPTNFDTPPALTTKSAFEERQQLLKLCKDYHDYLAQIIVKMVNTLPKEQRQNLITKNGGTKLWEITADKGLPSNLVLAANKVQALGIIKETIENNYSTLPNIEAEFDDKKQTLSAHRNSIVQRVKNAFNPSGFFSKTKRPFSTPRGQSVGAVFVEKFNTELDKMLKNSQSSLTVQPQ